MEPIRSLRIRLFVIQCLICIDSRIFVYGKMLVNTIDGSIKSQHIAGPHSVFLRGNNATQNASEKDNLTDNLHFRRRDEIHSDLFIKTHLSHFVNIAEHEHVTSREDSAKTGIFTSNSGKPQTMFNLNTDVAAMRGAGRDRWFSQTSRTTHSQNQGLQKRGKRNVLALELPQQRKAVLREVAAMLGISEESLEHNRASSGSRTFNRYRYIQELYTAMRESGALRENMMEEKRSLGTVRIYRGYRPKVRRRHSHTFHYDVSALSASVTVSRAELVLELPTDAAVTSLTPHLVVNVTIDDMPGSMTFHAESVNNFLVFNISTYAGAFRGRFRLELRWSADGEVVRIPWIRIPLLVYYENMSYNPLIKHAQSVNRERDRAPSDSDGRHARERLSKRDVSGDSPYQDATHISSHFPEHYFSDAEEQYRFFACSRKPWYINLDTFGWSSILAPTTYDAGYCQGECVFPLLHNMNSTSYSFIKNLWHVRTQFTDDYLPRACCTPVTYYPECIVYVEPSTDIVLTCVSNMRVATCGCR